jgi:hypothetical protein
MAQTLTANLVELRWLVCPTRPRWERKFAALLAAERFPHYLPLVARVRRYGTRAKHRGEERFGNGVANLPGVILAVDVLQQGLRVKLPADQLQILP